MTEQERRTVLHLLAAANESIKAALQIMLKDEPEAPAEEAKRQRRRVFGEQPMVGGSAVQPPRDGGT